VQVAIWCLGEFGDLLVGGGTSQEISVTEKDVIDMLERILKSPTTVAITKEYVLTAAMKLTARFGQSSLE
jgi:AP-1 complex subunit gamma-1